MAGLEGAKPDWAMRGALAFLIAGLMLLAYMLLF
jgi:hypothetical protein